MRLKILMKNKKYNTILVMVDKPIKYFYIILFNKKYIAE